MPVDTLFDKLAQLEVEPGCDTRALVMAQAVVKKKSSSLAVVKVEKRGYTAS